MPDATALPTERGPLFAPFNPTPDPVRFEPVAPDPPNVVEGPNWLIATSGLCACEYTVVQGDTCWSLTQDFGVEYSAIVDGRTSQACPDANLWEGDPMCITGPTKGQDKCAAAPTPAPSPTPGPSPGSCAWPAGFQTELYWMPATEKDPLLSDEILKRVTKVIMAFVGTYAFYYPFGQKDYDCKSTCTFAETWPVLTKGSEWAKRMKAVNPNLLVTISFGGWNQGPGDKPANCYSESGCYSDVSGLANQLASLSQMEGIDGIDLDYEMSDDLVGASPPGITFLGELSQALHDRGVAVSQAPQPPYMTSSPPDDPGAGSYVNLLAAYPNSKQDTMAIQYYNNGGYQIGVQDSAISANYWSAVSAMGGDASKVLLGLCFVDCNDGYSAYDPDDSAKSQALAPNLIKTTMAGGSGFGGIMIWANPKTTKSTSCTDANLGCLTAMPGWLDTICTAVQ